MKSYSREPGTRIGPATEKRITMNDRFDLTPRQTEPADTGETKTSAPFNAPALDPFSNVHKISRPVKVILVNDNRGTLELLETYLSYCFKNATLYSFTSGDAAWEVLQHTDPDMLITDMCRPKDVVDGWALIPLLTEKKVKYPVLVVSACSVFCPENAPEYFRAKSEDYFKLLAQAHRTIQISALEILIPFFEFELVISSYFKDGEAWTP
jgi:CheY-like chemotaxis protein